MASNIVNLDEVFDAVFKREPEKMFRKYYHIMTKDHEEKYYNIWLDFVIDKYKLYTHQKFQKHEAEAFAIADGLEALFSDYQKQKLKNRD